MFFIFTKCLCRTIACLGFYGTLLACAPAAARAQSADDVIDSAMYENPKLVTASIQKKFSPNLVPLWLQALGRPENDLKRRAAQAIGQARQRGLTTQLDVTVQPLLEALDNPQNDVSVRLACAQALITLDAKQHADRLFAHAQADGIDMRDIVEPALGRWGFKPAARIWLDRLGRPREPGRGWSLAISGLGMLGETQAIPRLRTLALDNETEAVIRLETARVLANMKYAGLVDDASALAEHPIEPIAFNQLMAATLLGKRRGERAIAFLQKLATQAAPVAQVAALDALLEADSRTILPILSQVISSRDAAVKLRGIEAFKQNPRTSDVVGISGLLDDPHSGVRNKARAALITVSGDATRRKLVIENATRLLRGDHWPALEQCALLMGLLQEKSAGPRLAELLEFPRPEVFVASAWALRTLAIPETLPRQTQVIERRFNESMRSDIFRPHFAMIEREVSQLCQSVGQARYTPAGPVLRRFVPYGGSIGDEARASAYWALGLIYEKKQPAGLVDQLIERLTTMDPRKPEGSLVRSMCVITLARMKAMAAEKAIRNLALYVDLPSTDILPYAINWSLAQLKGEELVTPGVLNRMQVGWFLEPID
jgi:HEAT repeat protein